MNRCQRVALPILIVLMSCVSAKAQTIYSFTGSTTSDLYYEPGYGCSPANPCSLSGEFILPSPLPAGLTFGTVTPSYWNFVFPHRAGFNFAPNPGPNVFEVATDSTGQITQWYIHLDDQFWNAGPDTLTFSGTPGSSFVHVYDWGDDPCVGCDNFYLSGSWASTPEPGTWVLFSTGLLFVLRKAATAKRRKRNAL